jgi:Rrf2 family transcriptional regulator, iron-sulfur cluster assembly transcription factor
MRLTTRGRFAVTAMADIAMHRGTDPVTLGEISARQKISVSYLEQLFGKMRRRGLVESVRGPGGGYRLARETAQIAVADIILAVDEPIDATQCRGKENCRDDQKCITHDLWAKLNEHVLKYLAAMTLKQLVEDQIAKKDGVSPLQNMQKTMLARELGPVLSQAI